MILHHLHHCGLSYADIISTIAAGIAGLILIIGYIQFSDFRKFQKVEFSYKVDADFYDFLDDPKNQLAKDWLLNDKQIDEKDYDQLDQLFNEIEAVYCLMRQKAIDDEMFYNSLSFYIEKVWLGNKKPSAREYIDMTRDKGKKNGLLRTDDLYEGVELLYKKIKRMNKTRPLKHDMI